MAVLVFLIIGLNFNYVIAAGTFTTSKLYLQFFMLVNSVNHLEIGPKPLWNATFTDKLRHDLLLNYDKFARPAQHFNVTKVQFSMRFRHFEANEFKSTLTAYCWLQLVIKIEMKKKLFYNNNFRLGKMKNFNGIHMIMVIWKCYG